MLAGFLALLEDEEDRARFARLYQTWRVRLYQVALNILREPAAAEDALHSAMVSVIQNFEKISAIPCKELGSYLVIIVKNAARDQLRKEAKYVSPEPERWDPPAPPDGTDGMERLIALIHTLPEGLRRPLEERYVLGYSNQEIARRMGLSESTVAQRLYRGRNALRELLEKEGYEL